jgi:hypothetical protein
VHPIGGDHQARSVLAVQAVNEDRLFGSRDVGDDSADPPRARFEQIRERVVCEPDVILRAPRALLFEREARGLSALVEIDDRADAVGRTRGKNGRADHIQHTA